MMFWNFSKIVVVSYLSQATFMSSRIISSGRLQIHCTKLMYFALPICWMLSVYVTRILFLYNPVKYKGDRSPRLQSIETWSRF